MNFRDAQRANDATIEAQYERANNDSRLFRDYVLFACRHDEDDVDAPPLTDYYAFPDGKDDDEIPSCVQIGHDFNGEWTWGICGNDWDFRKAAEVHRMPRLLPHEVQREFQSWLLKREYLKNQLALTRAEMVNVAAKYPTHVHTALALQVSHLTTELKLLEAA